MEKESKSVELNVSDLRMLSKIIDLASRRGAFQANELAQVGEAYNRLSAFLEFIDSSAAADESASKEQSTAE